MDTSLSGKYPIFADGGTIGELTVSAEGAFTLFRAQTLAMDGLFRLSVYGGGKEGYLGVMKPNGDGLELSRRLSRVSLLDFPDAITHGGRSFEPQSIPEPENISEGTETPSTEGQSGGTDVLPLPEQLGIPPPVLCLPCPNPCSLFSAVLEKSLFGEVRGALAGEREDTVYLYIPLSESRRCGLSGEPSGSYELFKIKNGALL